MMDLKAQIEQLQHELNAEYQRGALQNGEVIARLENRIEELKKELEKPDEDPVITKANEEVALLGTTLMPFCKNEVAYAAVRPAVMNKIYSLQDELTELQTHTEATESDLRNEVTELSKQIEERDAYISELKKELYDTKLLAEENANKRDAAVRETQEAKQTIESLNVKLAATEVTAPKTRTNVEGADVDATEKFKQSLPLIYDVTPLDNRRSRFSAKFAGSEEPFEDYYIYKDGKYREVQAEEAATFRTEFLAKQEQERNHEDMAQHSSVEDEPVTVPAFRDEDTNSTTSGMDQADTSGEVARPSVEKRLEALELAVFGSVRDAA
ncbi:hypothetical protein NST28_29140 [Paenibacillus sp. FSL R10-2791]|uniref:hypothetical protein n=1 Tax=Paenibacillus sp. FSL R10-2791 TaxID=2954695 RepID=UPI0030FC798C